MSTSFLAMFQGLFKLSELNKPFGTTPQSAETKREFWWINGIFILLNSIFLFNGFYWFVAAPALLIVIALSFSRMDILLFAIAFFTPFSVDIRDIGLGFGISLPSEPLMMLMLVVFGAKVLLTGGYDRKILTHPVTIIIIIHLLWMLITAISSSMPLISFKFFLARLWFVSLFYFLATSLFSTFRNAKIFVWLVVVSLSLVICYTIYMHYLTGFNDRAAHWVMSPFFNDHTAYAAVIVMFLPIVSTFMFNKTAGSFSRIAAAGLFLLFIVALVLSYTRAAWVSVLVSICVLFIFIFKIKFRTLFLAGAALLILFFSFQTQIFLKLERNRQDSSKDFSRHIKSISNISTDASNLERINRWHSAWRMFLDKPVLGFGPGTYQFQYAPFQHSHDKTIISTNAGTMGTAHSEYLLLLAEQGLFGMVFFVLVVTTVSWLAVKVYKESEKKETQIFVLSIFLGLVTYFVHGALNNFLDTDKASVPFWGFIAMLVATDIANRDSKEKIEK